MVGLIHRVLFDLIESAGGSDAVAEVRRRADVAPDRKFQIDQAYDDDEWRRLLAATCEVLNVTPEQACDAYADAFGRDAQERFPTWFMICKTSRDFLLQQPAIHNAFATGLSDAASRQQVIDKFHVEMDGDTLVTKYRSPNRLCGLYMSLARWIVNHYGETATIEERACMSQGADACEIHVRWRPGE